MRSIPEPEIAGGAHHQIIDERRGIRSENKRAGRTYLLPMASPFTVVSLFGASQCLCLAAGIYTLRQKEEKCRGRKQRQGVFEKRQDETVFNDAGMVDGDDRHDRGQADQQTGENASDPAIALVVLAMFDVYDTAYRGGIPRPLMAIWGDRVARLDAIAGLPVDGDPEGKKLAPWLPRRRENLHVGRFARAVPNRDGRDPASTATADRSTSPREPCARRRPVTASTATPSPSPSPCCRPPVASSPATVFG